LREKGVLVVTVEREGGEGRRASERARRSAAPSRRNNKPLPARRSPA
jgi:hypothetical protein